MEAVLMNTTADYKHRIGNRRNFLTNRTSLYSYPSDDLLLTTVLSGGHFAGTGLFSMPAASLSHSFPAPQNLYHLRQQPPLLPLPTSKPIINHQNMNNIYRSNSSSSPYNNNIRINKNVKNRVRDHSLTPKKSKNQKKNSKDLIPPAPEEKKASPATPPEEKETSPSISEIIGPDPKDLPKDVISRVFSSSVIINKSCDNIVSIDVDKFSGSVVFTPSPPPSSLPLPTFSLRPKLGCNAQAAAGVDAGATDSLRRLLRL